MNLKRFSSALPLCALLALWPALPARAAQIQGVTVSSVSLEYTSLSTSNPDRREARNVVGNVGLFGDVHTQIPSGSMWLAANPAGTTGAGTANAGTNFIVFNLGAVHTVDAMKVWNYNEGNAAGTLTTGTNQGVKLANISYSTDGVNFTTNLPNQLFNIAPGTYSNFSQTIPMGGVLAQYVRIDVITNWHTTANKPVGLAKVRFIDNSVPPTLASASSSYGSNQVTVVFSEPVDPATATNKANYVLQSGANTAVILSAAMGQYDDRVVLQTSLLTNQNYTLTASGVYDQAKIIPIANNSTVAVQPELVLWLAADQGVSTDDYGNVTQWNDRSGYGHNALTNLAVNQYSLPPTLLQGVLNNKPVVSFNGTQLMNVPHDANLALNGDMALCLVFNKNSSALGDPISKTGGLGNVYHHTSPLGDWGYTNNMPGPFDFQLNSSQKPVLVWGNGAAGGGFSSLTGPAINFGQYYIVTMVVRGTNISCYLNGGFAGSALALVGPADAGNPLMLGVRADSGNVQDAGAVFNGNLAEAMIVRGSLTPNDLVSMNSYLGAKYDIPIVSLGISEPPQSVTTQVGKKATFWVNAVGVPPLSYQWKSNNVAISGATSAIYTTPALTAAANGATYTVTVSCPIGTTNSNPATLTVLSDTTAPTIFSASKTTSGTGIVVAYSEAVGANAINPTSYSLNGGVTVLAASYGSSASNQVILTTTALDPGTAYYLTVQNVADLFGNTLTPTTVPVLPPNLALYLRADSGVVLDSNGLVAQCLDQTTNGNNAVQFVGGPTARPATGIDTMNGLPTLTFNANLSNYLQAASSPSLALAGDMSVVAVANFSDYSSPREILGKTVLNQPASYDYYVSSATDFRLYRGNGIGAAAVGRATAAPATGSPHVIAVTMAGTNVAHYLDGLANGTASVSTTLADGGTALRIGSRDDLTQFMSGDIAEIMLFSSALSTNDRVAVDNYLGLKYFPFTITQQPMDVTTPQGVTATFTVVASQGSAHLNYQWRKNGIAIAGATNAVYTTPILAPSDNGSTFDVAITIPGLATNLSTAATLTVNNTPPLVTTAGIPIWSRTNVVLVFSEAVDPVTGAATGNYSLDNGATVLAAAIGDTPNKVVLTTSLLSPGTAYSVTVQNVKDLYNNTIATATLPLGVYPAGTALWLRADTGVLFDPGTGLVSEWDDQSGNGNNMVAGTPPVLVPNALNAQPVVRFDGVSTYMYANSSASLALTGDLSIFAVVNYSNLNSSGSYGMIVSKTSGALPASFDYYTRSTALQFYRGNGNAYGLVQASAVPSIGRPHMLDVVMAGTSVTHRLDGNANGTGSITAPIGDTGEPLMLGSREDAGNHLYGDLAELVIVGAGVSSNDVALLEAYLATKYEFPLGSQSYPVITHQPVASTNVNQNSTLMVAAAATGNPAVAYQWYDLNNLAVAGQTNASLVISNIQTSDSYYLVATNIFGSATSSVVAVTVYSGAPQVSLAPASLSLYAGHSYTYAVNAYGTAPLAYQWYQNGAPIGGATGPAYTLAVPQGTNTFSCTVSNSLAVVPSGAVTLVGVSAPASLYAASVLSNNPVAYWRLDETSGSAVAMDYVGGHSLVYSNAQLGVNGYSSFDADTAVGFGSLLASNSYAGEIDNSTSGVPNIDFSQPTGANAQFSVAAWVNSSAAQTGGAGIVTKGYGNGGEQFDLDMGSPLGFRFFVRDAAGGVHSANSSVVSTIGQWYHLVGVWDGPNGAVQLYINGVKSAEVTNIATGLGLKATSTSNTQLPTPPLVSLGARAANLASTAYDLQFKGTVDEVAIYPTALSASQIAGQYQAAVNPPRETLGVANLGGGWLQLNWSFGTLQSAPAVGGPYSDINNATSPYLLQTTNAQRYFRIREN